jgi:hypothetical protein
MNVPAILLAFSLAVGAFAVFRSGLVLSDLFLLAMISACASLILLALRKPRNARALRKPRNPRALRDPRKEVRRPANRDTPLRGQGKSGLFARQRPPKRYILVDGSNVMHWKDETPQLSTVREVVQELTARGFHPGVMFDANVGWKITGRYQDDAELAMVLGLPVDRVLVVPKGIQADPYLLMAARDLGARIVSKDRFRDWAEAHPEVGQPGFLMRGGYHQGKLWIEDGAVAERMVGA